MHYFFAYFLDERDLGIVVHYCFGDFKPNIGVENGRIGPVTHFFFAYYRTSNATSEPFLRQLGPFGRGGMSKHALLLGVFAGEERAFDIIVHHCFADFKPNIGE